MKRPESLDQKLLGRFSVDGAVSGRRLALRAVENSAGITGMQQRRAGTVDRQKGAAVLVRDAGEAPDTAQTHRSAGGDRYGSRFPAECGTFSSSRAQDATLI